MIKSLNFFWKLCGNIRGNMETRESIREICVEGRDKRDFFMTITIYNNVNEIVTYMYKILSHYKLQN